PKKYYQALRIIVVILIIVYGSKLIVKDSNLKSTEDILHNTSSLAREYSDSNYIHFPQPNTFNRGECITNPVRYFVVLSLPRSGTGWFTSLLNNHTNIDMHGEMFANRYRRQNIVETLDRFYNMDLEENVIPKNECTAA
ncbi:hypothetical protein M569_08917, partial [Genlisea aurea]